MTSPPVTWDGLNLNPLAEDATGLLPVVEDVTGWYDTPDYNGNDTALVLADGSLLGPKTANARTVVISGSVVGPPDQLALFRDLLVVRAAALLPAELTIPDAAGRVMTATVRCDSDGLKHTFNGPGLFTYQATMLAPDPRLYGPQQTARLSNFAGGTTGWAYDDVASTVPPTNMARVYPRSYAATSLPNTASLPNEGSAAAPVTLAVTGDLSSSRLVDNATGNAILIAAVPAGAVIYVDTESLTAWAPGGASRASYILPGSVPLLVPPMTTANWSLYATGGGTVDLFWRSAWQ